MRATRRRYVKFLFAPALIITALLTRNLPMSDRLRTYISASCIVLGGILLIVGIVWALRLAADIRRDQRLFQENAERLRQGTWKMTGEIDDTETMG